MMEEVGWTGSIFGIGVLVLVTTVLVVVLMRVGALLAGPDPAPRRAALPGASGAVRGLGGRREQRP